jgi:cytochrome b6-f complex iron-sulfur subunit
LEALPIGVDTSDMSILQNGGSATEPISRRDALARLATGSVLLAAVIALLVFLGVPIPSSLRERTLVRVGNPDQFPFNAFTFVPERNIFVFRTREGFKALSALCPHLGCVITSHGPGFRCPCHGSTFDPRGSVLEGPAPRPLSWLKVGMAPDGQITVDTSERVSAERLLKV